MRIKINRQTPQLNRSFPAIYEHLGASNGRGNKHYKGVIALFYSQFTFVPLSPDAPCACAQNDNCARPYWKLLDGSVTLSNE